MRETAQHGLDDTLADGRAPGAVSGCDEAGSRVGELGNGEGGDGEVVDHTSGFEDTSPGSARPVLPDLDDGVGGEEGVGGGDDLRAGHRRGEAVGEASDRVAPEEGRS